MVHMLHMYWSTLYVCVLVTQVSCAKAGEPIVMYVLVHGTVCYR